ncbi:MAG: ABC transporter permease, partial [Enterococcus devriesei]
MSKVIQLTKVEGKLALRSIDGVLFGIGMPLGVLLLTTMIAGSKQAGAADYTFLDSSFSSLLVVGICATAFMGIPLTICDYRDKKILKHFFVTPASPGHLIATQVVVAMITAIISAILVALVSVVFLDYRMQGSWGLLIASLCKNIKIANLVCSL